MSAEPFLGNEPLIDPERVCAVFIDCLFKVEEVIGGKPCLEPVIVEGILDKLGFHPERLETHRAEVLAWLLALPQEFMKSKGGGWSFLNACNDSNGVQWTGLHQRMDQLFSMGIGLGLASYQLPRDMWDAFPGGMPYIVVDDTKAVAA